MLWTDKAKKYLKKYWKIDNLKDKQIEVINELLLGHDVIGLLPTGYGKSMCYLIPPLVTKKVMFIISPLISLMDDQKDKLVKMNIPCSALHGNNSNKEEEVFKIIDGEIKIVYMSPEYLIKSDGMELAETLIQNDMMGFLAVDESHCISVWGQDFRPEYTKIKLFRENFPQIPIIAVTATATSTVCNDITKLLCMDNPSLVRASFDRPNLYLKVSEIPTESVVEKTPKGKRTKIVQRTIPKEKLVLNYVNKYPNDKIIVYANSRKDTESISMELNKLFPNISESYHAGLPKKKREEIQSNFAEGKFKVIVATIAFGMGIDQTVKTIIIFGSPSSIEEYYQQVGRGGRDGLHCDTILYFDYGNLMIGKYMLKDIRFKFPVLYKAKLDNLNKVAKFAFSNTCRRKYILEYFNESCNFFTCNNCDNCCENELVDMTDKLWDSVFNKKNSNMISIAAEIRANFLTSISELDKNNKDKQIDLDLVDPLWKWRTYISENKIKKENVPENMKLKIPKKFIKVEEEKLPAAESIDDKITYYEKFL